MPGSIKKRTGNETEGRICQARKRESITETKEAHIRWTRDRSRVNWEEFVRCQVRADETYSMANREFSDGNKDVLMNVHSPHKWWSTLKYAVRCSARVRHCLR